MHTHAHTHTHTHTHTQLFPQVEAAMVTPLRQSLEYYERLKETEDLTLIHRKEVSHKSLSSINQLFLSPTSNSQEVD